MSNERAVKQVLVDEEFMERNKAGMQRMFEVIPRGNGKYITFVKTILKLMADDKYGRGLPHSNN